MTIPLPNPRVKKIKFSQLESAAKNAILITILLLSMISFLFLMASKVTLGIETLFRNRTDTETKGLIYNKWTLATSSV